MLRSIEILAGACVLAATPVALAVPIVSVDAPGTVSAGSSFSVDITISGVDNLNGFELDLLFDPSVLAAVFVSDGGFLGAPVFEVQNDIGLMKVEFAEVILGPGGASGAGVLATIGFDALLPGVSVLDLQNVLLAAPFGVPIPVGVLGGSVAVAPLVAVIPEPTASLLYAVGFACVACRRRRVSEPGSRISSLAGAGERPESARSSPTASRLPTGCMAELAR
jgi:hypothetical protein